MSTLLAESTATSLAPLAEARCLYCGSAQLTVLYTGVRDRLGYVPGERTWYRCNDCGSAVLVPLPKAEELAAFYPPVYSFTPEMGRTSRFARVMSWLEYHLFFRPMYVSEARTVAKATGGPKAGRRLLDIGAGRGLRLLEFRRLGYDVHALDLQDDVCRYLNDELRIPAVCADVSDATNHYEPESFDLVTAFQLMEHVLDVREFLESSWELLRPGGWVAFAMPLCDSVQAQLFRSCWINFTEAPRHVSLPTRQGLLFAFSSVGFKHIHVIPDALINCAGCFALSVVASATFTHAYGGSHVRQYFPRIVGAAAMVSALPFCVIENHVTDRMPLGIVFGRKPD